MTQCKIKQPHNFPNEECNVCNENHACTHNEFCIDNCPNREAEEQLENEIEEVESSIYPPLTGEPN